MGKGVKSKRVTTHTRDVINKRVKQHKRKMKKEASKLSKAGLKRKTKSNQNMPMPNMMPLKRKMISALAAKKSSVKGDSVIEKLKNKTTADLNQSVVQEDPQVREDKYLEHMEASMAKGPKKKTNYMKELKQVIENSDIILEVLDARDPEGCRCREMEAEVLARAAGDKKIILILNKIDLVPIEVVQAWKKRLEREYATVLFKGNTQGQSANLGSAKLFNNAFNDKKELVNQLLSSSKSIGPDKLMELIKNYSKTDGVKKAVTVGVIGFPNVGKSS